MSEKTKAWLKALAERTLSTAAETALGVIGGAAVFGEVNWRTVISATGLSIIVSILKNLIFTPTEVKAVTK